MSGTDSLMHDPVAWYERMKKALMGMICFGGLDLGAVNDFSCLTLYFPKQVGLAVAVMLMWSWAPENVEYHAILKERFGYDEWVRHGFLKLTSGVRTDYSVIREDIRKLDQDYHIEEIRYDPRYSFQLVQELEAAGVSMVEHKQGSFSMTGPIKEFQRLILGKDFVHGNNPLLNFMVDNLVVKSDGQGNLTCVKPDNPNSPRKIDGAVASIMAISGAAANPEAVGGNSGRVFFG